MKKASDRSCNSQHVRFLKEIMMIEFLVIIGVLWYVKVSFSTRSLNSSARPESLEIENHIIKVKGSAEKWKPGVTSSNLTKMKNLLDSRAPASENEIFYGAAGDRTLGLPHVELCKAGALPLSHSPCEKLIWWTYRKFDPTRLYTYYVTLR